MSSTAPPRNWSSVRCAAGTLGKSCLCVLFSTLCACEALTDPSATVGASAEAALAAAETDQLGSGQGAGSGADGTATVTGVNLDRSLNDDQLPALMDTERNRGELMANALARMNGGRLDGQPLLERHCDVGLDAAADPQLIDDFEDGNTHMLGPGREGYWFAYDDGSQKLFPAADGFLPTDAALWFASDGFEVFGAGLGVPFARSAANTSCLYDASDFTGLSFSARGEVVFVGGDLVAPPQEDAKGALRVALAEKETILRSSGGFCEDPVRCYDSHHAYVELTEEPTVYYCPFRSFQQAGWGVDVGPLDVGDLVVLSFAVAQGNRFDVTIDDVRFYAGKPPEGAVACTRPIHLTAQ